MLWLKALHVAFMVTWFAGLFYLPRLFVYHVEATDEISLRRFAVMERRLFGIMTIGAVLTATFGAAMLVQRPAVATALWFELKAVLVVLLIGYHYWCARLMGALARGKCTRSPRWLRLFNEVPGIALLAIVILAVVKPV